MCSLEQKKNTEQVNYKLIWLITVKVLSSFTTLVHVHVHIHTHPLFLHSALITREKKEHSKVEHGIASLQNDMVRLNTLITEKRGDEEKLQQENILAENDFIYALKVRGKTRWMDLYSCSLRMERKEISLSSIHVYQQNACDKFSGLPAQLNDQ